MQLSNHASTFLTQPTGSTTILTGDALTMLATLPANSAQMCVTSPPYYGLRDYGEAEQIGLEGTPEAYITNLVSVFAQVRRVLRKDGTLWLNLGDSYGKNGQLMGIPWRVALALQAEGWILRQDIIWHKPNPMPESVRNRCTKAHEYIFLFSKDQRYTFNQMKEPATSRYAFANTGAKAAANADRNDGNRSRILGDGTKNTRSVWQIASKPYKGTHFAPFPPLLAERCILAGSNAGDMVLDPFGGSGTTAAVANRHGRNATLVELNPDYVQLATQRIADALNQ